MPATLPCPDAAALEHFLLGHATAEQAEQLEAHVAGCARCTQSLRGLRAIDELVGAMREAGTQPVAPCVDAAAALIPWLKRLRPKDATQTLVGAGAAADTPATYDFLNAPCATDELGRLGIYRVLKPLGVGGMGIVFLAEDTRLKRRVALKLIKPELLAREDLHERFMSEAQAIAAVEHDNIVAIFESGEASGVPYLVMPLLQGESLEDYLQRHDGPLPVDEVLRLGREIAAGLAAAHERRVVHRDIKPRNLWLEAGPARRVKILDFGLARTVEGAGDEGGPGLILGTPAYMAPEQTRGPAADARADLFSLGCVLYRLATGRLPFQGTDVVTTLLNVATATPPPPRSLNPKLPANVAALIERLLAKQPDDRYGSAAEVVDATRAIEQRRRPRTLWRWLALTAACVALATAGTFGVLYVLHQPPTPVEVRFEYDEPDAVLLVRRDDGGEEEIDVARTPKQSLRPGQYVVRPRAASPERTLVPSSFVVELGQPLTLPLRLVGLVRTLHGHSLGVNAVAFLRPDSPLALSGGSDHDLRLWDTSKDSAGVRLVGHASPVHCLAVTPDGKRAVTGSGQAHRRVPDVFVRVWDVAARTCLATLAGHESSVTAVAVDSPGRWFLSGDRDGMLFIWDAKTLTLHRSIAAHDRSDINGLAVLPGGKQALSCGGDKRVLLWDLDKQAPARKPLLGHTEAVTGVSAAPDGQRAASASRDGTVRLWDLERGDSRVLKGHDGDVNAIAYSPDGKRLLSGGRDQTVRLWNAESGALIHTFAGHHQSVRAVAFAPDGRRALSGGADGVVCLWELPK
jgi:WD40 repeat protein/tRNA A-37 threonylcarbamoyl transferase component Bud32